MKKISLVLIAIFVLCTNIVFAESGENIFNNDITTPNEFEIINENANNNIMKFGSNVVATGTAEDLILLAGESVVSNAFGKYAFIVGSEITISENIEKDAFIAGKSIVINGNIERDLYIVGNSVIISGNVDRNINICATSLEISEGSTVGGNINATAVGMLKIADGATVNGTVRCSEASTISIPEGIKTSITPAEIDEEFNQPTIFDDVGSMFFWIFANVLFFSLALLLCPAMFEKIRNAYENKKGKVYLTSLGWGAVMLFAIPFLAIILMITIIGAIAGFAALIMYLILMMISTITVGYLLGTTIFSKTKANKWVCGLTGIVILEVVSLVPYIGGMISFAKILIGLGVVVELFKKQEIAPKEDLV